MQTKPISEYTPQDIQKMDYNQLIGLVKETNRPPGGVRSIAQVAQRAFLRPDSRVLEIGTSTGVTAIELARLVGCHINAIDINPVSIEEARSRAEQTGVARLIDFEVQDATRTRFSPNTFDMVFCGNVTSLIKDREAALKEYCRVLKPGGYVAAIPMYYVKEPSATLLQKVSAAIHVEIKPLQRGYWMEFFQRPPLETYWTEDYHFDHIEDAAVDRFVKDILTRPHLAQLRADTREALSQQYRDFMYLFRDNLSHMGFTLMLMRRETNPTDPELFTSHRVSPA